MNTSLACSTNPIKKENSTVVYQPRYHVDRSDEDTIVQVELPGLAKEDINIRVEAKELILEGKMANKRPDTWKALHRESVDRVYQLRLRLGETIDHNSINAQMADGILTLIFPKLEAAKPQKIKVK